jgi:hypothetical protein
MKKVSTAAAKAGTKNLTAEVNRRIGSGKTLLLKKPTLEW